MWQHQFRAMHQEIEEASGGDHVVLVAKQLEDFRESILCSKGLLTMLLDSVQLLVIWKGCVIDEYSCRYHIYIWNEIEQSPNSYI